LERHDDVLHVHVTSFDATLRAAFTRGAMNNVDVPFGGQCFNLRVSKFTAVIRLEYLRWSVFGPNSVKMIYDLVSRLRTKRSKDAELRQVILVRKVMMLIHNEKQRKKSKMQKK
jgi:hypothetical protein